MLCRLMWTKRTDNPLMYSLPPFSGSNRGPGAGHKSDQERVEGKWERSQSCTHQTSVDSTTREGSREDGRTYD